MLRRKETPLPRPDFVARPPSHRRLATLLAAAAALWLTGAVADAYTLGRQVDAARAEHARWEARRVATAAERTRREPTAPPEELRRKAWRIGEALQFPWAGTLAALESRTTDGLRWLALDIDRERGSFRLEGIAADAPAALATGDAVAALPGFADVVTARLATLDGMPGQRFEVSGRLLVRNAAALEKAP